MVARGKSMTIQHSDRGAGDKPPRYQRFCTNEERA